METRQFGKSTTGICIEIGNKCLGSCLIIFLGNRRMYSLNNIDKLLEVKVAHSQHIQGLFRLVRTFKNSD